MATSRSDALAVIDRWCDFAHGAGLRQHLTEFWTVRDLLEGIVPVSPGRAEQAITFVRDKCKPSAEREQLLAALTGGNAMRDEGGPAFPVQYDNNSDEYRQFYGADVPPRSTFVSGGMTLRDWFAGQALAGMLVNPDNHVTVATAYDFADAMLAERRKETP